MQIAQLRAELEKARSLRQSSERVVSQLRDQLKKTANEKDILLRTTEIYEADKRELENEVSSMCIRHVSPNSYEYSLALPYS